MKHINNKEPVNYSQVSFILKNRGVRCGSGVEFDDDMYGKFYTVPMTPPPSLGSSTTPTPRRIRGMLCFKQGPLSQIPLPSSSTRAPFTPSETIFTRLMSGVLYAKNEH